MTHPTTVSNIRTSTAAAVMAAYAADRLFTRIEFDKGRIFAATAYKSGILLPR